MAADFLQTAGWTSRRRQRRFPANGEQGRAAGSGGAPSPQKRICLLGPVFCHGAQGSQERGGEELLLNTLFKITEIAGDKLHTGNDVKTGHRGRETQGF